MNKALIIDSHKDSQIALSNLLKDHYQTLVASSEVEAFRTITLQAPDVILVESWLADITGAELCAKLKNSLNTKDIPVIFVSHKDDIDTKVAAFNSGADDFLSKPFLAQELLIRMQARLRGKCQRKVFQAGNLSMDVDSRKTFVENKEVTLTKKEFDLLQILVSNKERVVERKSALSTIWVGTSVTSRNIDSHVANLKKKIDGFNGSIEAVPGVGYRLTEKTLG